VHFVHDACAELGWDDIDTSLEFLGRGVRLPIFISCMTGGSEGGFRGNRGLANAAGILGIPVGTGSVRVLLDHPELDSHFALKSQAPSVPLLANIGAVQVRDLDPSRLDDIMRRLDADALVIHLNPGQELFQPDGDRDFRGVRDGIARFIARAPYPVIVKETGFGIAPDESSFLLDAGAAYVSELEDTEDRLLHAFREAQADTTSPDVQRAIAAYLPQVQACHDEMKLLKDAARADSAALRKDVDSQHSLADRDQKDRLQNEGGATQPGRPPQEKSPAELIGHAHGQPTSPGDTKPKS